MHLVQWPNYNRPSTLQHHISSTSYMTTQQRSSRTLRGRLLYR